MESEVSALMVTVFPVKVFTTICIVARVAWGIEKPHSATIRVTTVSLHGCDAGLLAKILEPTKENPRSHTKKRATLGYRLNKVDEVLRCFCPRRKKAAGRG